MQETWDMGLILGLGKSPGGGHGNPLQYFCLANPMDRGTWQTVPSMGSQGFRHDWVHTDDDGYEHHPIYGKLEITKVKTRTCSLCYLLCSQERERKTHFFPLFIAQSGDKNHMRHRWLLLNDSIHNLKLMRPKEIEVDQAEASCEF